MKHAFTLIELLVVVTIIVVLLALLMPAIDKSIYQAELAQCGAKLRSVSMGTGVYALDHNRFYPYRALARRGIMRPVDIQYYYPTALPPRIDDRPVLQSYMAINQQLQCPLAPEVVDIESPSVTTNIALGYGLWFDFAFVGEVRMTKLNSRFSWAGDSYSLLAGDWSGLFDGSNEIAPHNDASGRMRPATLQDQESRTGMKDAPYNFTYSYWSSGAPGYRDTLDLNFTYPDGSVLRLDRVRWDEGLPGETDERVIQLPQWDRPSQQAIAKVQIPKG